MPEFNDWFPTSLHGDNALNVMNFGAFADGAGHTMDELYPGNLAAAQADYPSATSLSDTADWCAITEAFKQAFKHETSPGVWELNGTASWLNKPVFIPSGQYLTNKPLVLKGVDHANIYGAAYTQIYNQNTTAPNNVCILIDGSQNSRFEHLEFQSAGGTSCVAVDLDAETPGPVNTTGNLFINCFFEAPGGMGCRIGKTQMSSEATFIQCRVNNCAAGWVIEGWNALNYHFLGCGGTLCTLNWIRVNAGGNIVVQNASLAGNGTDPDGWDISVGNGTAVILGSRTESKRFVFAGAPTAIMNCSQTGEGNDLVFAAGHAHIVGCMTTMGRLSGTGLLTTEGCGFNLSGFFLTAVASGTAGAIRVTHSDTASGSEDCFLDGDEVEIYGLTSTNTTATGGMAKTNGIWTITKIDATHCELNGSTFVADTYNYTEARIKPGPRFHLRDTLHVSGDLPGEFQVPTLAKRHEAVTKRRDFYIQFCDSGKVFDNYNATGEVVFTLPNVSGQYNHRGIIYRFVVLTGQTLKVLAYDSGVYSSPHLSARIFRAGGFATAGTDISSNVVGNSIELYLADGDNNDPGNLDYAAIPTGFYPQPSRWVVISETGTWTIAGTPRAPT